MERKSINIKMDPDLWKKINQHCIRKNKDVSEYLEETIIKDLISHVKWFSSKNYLKETLFWINMADDKIRLPSGQGGLTRYFDEYSSKVEISPGAVVVLAIIIMILVILLHYFGEAFFN